jgi:hypothetical protein
VLALHQKAQLSPLSCSSALRTCFLLHLLLVLQVLLLLLLLLVMTAAVLALQALLLQPAIMAAVLWCWLSAVLLVRNLAEQACTDNFLLLSAKSAGKDCSVAFPCDKGRPRKSIYC